jgi:hypothetical protein
LGKRPAPRVLISRDRRTAVRSVLDGWDRARGHRATYGPGGFGVSRPRPRLRPGCGDGPRSAVVLQLGCALHSAGPPKERALGRAAAKQSANASGPQVAPVHAKEWAAVFP